MNTSDEPELAELGGLLSSSSTPGSLPEHERCRRVWIRIILQQLSDSASKSSKGEALALKQQAIAWLTSNSSDFRQVCDNAGFNPDNVYRACKRIFGSDHPERYLQALFPQTRNNGTKMQSRRGPKPKTILDYVPKPPKQSQPT